MTPERMAGLVASWVRVYTRGLPTPVAERRIEEIGADLHDHVTHERAAGTGELRITFGVASRMVRGAAADAAWRRRQRPPQRRSQVHRSIVRVSLAVALILSVPAAATVAGGGTAWGLLDFVLAAVMLGGVGALIELVVHRRGGLAFRTAVGLTLAAVLALVWMVAALGVTGRTGDPADAMYAGVLAVGVVGAVMTRLRPEGMARTLVAMAIAQALVTAVALLAGRHQEAVTSLGELLALNGIFIALFLGSAWLFHQAARRPPSSEPVPQG